MIVIDQPPRPEPIFPVGDRAAEPIAPPYQQALAALRRLQNEHPLWRCRLLSAFAQGALSRDDLRDVFSQYHHYTSSFTRLIAAVMASCENDLFRAQLSQNLWEEGGGCEPERRHAVLFRRFLERSLDVDDVTRIAYAPHTRWFVAAYLDYARRASAAAGAAFLSLGTEGIVARMYQIMRSGLRQAGVPDGELEFFDLHIACDDDHAVTLEQMMLSYAGETSWFETCAAAARHALDLRLAFFEDLYDALASRRVAPVLRKIQARSSLAPGVAEPALVHRPGDSTIAMYANEVERLNISFTVERLPLSCEVLDPRMVRIPPGKFNERHKHAHETLLHFLAGAGQVVLDDRVIAVRAGDSVIVPRWAMHQTQNLGDVELRFLAVTDFQLTRQVLIGDASDYRMTADIDAPRRSGHEAR